MPTSSSVSSSAHARSWTSPSGRVSVVIALAGALTVFAASATPHAATNDDARPAIQLSTSVSERLANDTMRATIEIRERAADLADASRAVNTRVAALVERLRAEPEIAPEGQRYGSWRHDPMPRPTEGASDAAYWEVTYAVTLRQIEAAPDPAAAGRDAFAPAFETLSALLGELQEQGIALTAVSFDVSREAQDEARVRLLPRAIESLERQARATAQALGAQGIQVHSVQVHEDFGGYAPTMRSEAMPMAIAADAMPAPRFDRGESEIRLSVSGNFTLIDPPRRSLD